MLRSPACKRDGIVETIGLQILDNYWRVVTMLLWGDPLSCSAWVLAVRAVAGTFLVWVVV